MGAVSGSGGRRQSAVMALCATACLAMACVPSASLAETAVKLPVIFIPQVPPGNWEDTANCGPACLVMAAAYARREEPRAAKILKVDRFLGLDENGRPCTHCDQLVRAGKAVFGLTLKADPWSLAAVKKEIVAGGPVIVELEAGCLSNRGYSYGGSHFVAAIGLDRGRIICHDPMTPNGKAKAYAVGEFEAAMAGDTGLVVHGFRRR